MIPMAFHVTNINNNMIHSNGSDVMTEHPLKIYEKIFHC